MAGAFGIFERGFFYGRWRFCFGYFMFFATIGMSYMLQKVFVLLFMFLDI